MATDLELLLARTVLKLTNRRAIALEGAVCLACGDTDLTPELIHHTDDCGYLLAHRLIANHGMSKKEPTDGKEARRNDSDETHEEHY